MNDLKTIKMSLTYSQCPNKRERTTVESGSGSAKNYKAS